MKHLKTKDKKARFGICFGEDYLKIIKYIPNRKKAFFDFKVVHFPVNPLDKEIIDKTFCALKDLGYNNNPIMISLPRNQATCRYVKIPTRLPSEIEKIIPFQTSKYLPYPNLELITSYQTISSDKSGYSHINLNIVHKDVVSRYLSILKSLAIKNFSILLSSYGLYTLYNEIAPKDNGTTMIVDVDTLYAELIVASQKKLIFSRSIKITQQQTLEQQLADEIIKTNNAYTKETNQPLPEKVIIFTNKNIDLNILKSKVPIPIETLGYLNKNTWTSSADETIKSTGVSVASLIGFMLKKASLDLNILPVEIKETRKRYIRKKEFLKSVFFAAVTLLVFTLAIIKNIDNKTAYREKLKSELEKLSPEARRLELLEHRFTLLQSQGKERLALLDVLYELHKVMPQNILLSNFTYEENNQIVLRGQTPNLDSVLDFVSYLEKSQGFKEFSVKMRYATKKKTSMGEFIDFEIICLKKGTHA
ncbi:MAG: PilN domain-containing protein [Candidatus Omnitrophota bacterium]|jgi:hypothetical protein